MLAGFTLRLCSGGAGGGRGAVAAASSTAWGGDSNSVLDTDNSLDTGELFLKMMGAMALIIALGVGLVYVSRRFLPKVGSVPGRRIQIAETVPLGAKKALHLVEVGGRKVLIGSTAEKITMLADISEGYPGSDNLKTRACSE